jgi:glycosyltransferase involved in cell wall biosynthesis
LFAHSSAELYGADRILLELTDGLHRLGFQVSVVLPGPGPLHGELQSLGVGVLRRNLGVLRRRYFNPLGLLNRFCRVSSAVRFIRREIRDHGVDVVHSNTTAVLAGVIAARLSGVPHVWHVHEITTRPFWFAKTMAFCVGRLTDRAVFVSEATRDHMCSLNAAVRRKSVVIHNGIDPRRALQGCLGQVRAECGWTSQQVVIGMLGRINWWKGQDKLLDCAIGLSSRYKSLRFLMVGGTFDGENQIRDRLLERIEKQSLTGIVVLQDFRPDVGNVFSDIDVFVLPSTEPDPFPTVVLEAMAAGKPIVAFRHGGVCEMVADGTTGLLCTPGSSVEMSEAIARLADSPELRQSMGSAGRDRLHQLFTRDAFIDRFSALYIQMAAAA